MHLFLQHLPRAGHNGNVAGRLLGAAMLRERNRRRGTTLLEVVIGMSGECVYDQILLQNPPPFWLAVDQPLWSPRWRVSTS